MVPNIIRMGVRDTLSCWPREELIAAIIDDRYQKLADKSKFRIEFLLKSFGRELAKLPVTKLVEACTNMAIDNFQNSGELIIDGGGKNVVHFNTHWQA